MKNKTFETVIVGAGISGLACARRLNEKGEDFQIISEDIGGRILTSEDGTVNYGAFFVYSDYYNMLKFVKLESKIRLRDFCFHEDDKAYVLFEPGFIKYSFQFIKVLKLLYKFRRAFRKLRKTCEIISQKEAIENDPFLFELYMQNAADFVQNNSIENGTDKYLSKGLYSITFSAIHEMNSLTFMQFIISLITPIYKFKFEKDRMTQPFKENITIGHVDDLTYKNGYYKIKTNGNFIQSKNIVLATQIDWSKRFAGVKKINLPVDAQMIHVKGSPKNIISKKDYQLFGPPSNVHSIANLKDGAFLFYYKNKQPSLNNYFYNPQIIAKKDWNLVGTINGHTLIESNRGNNMYLIGDYNLAGLEEAFITGIFAANKIINSK
jgi:hypothetical protein